MQPGHIKIVSFFFLTACYSAQSSDQQNHLPLPFDVFIYHIFNYLDSDGFTALATTCKSLNTAAQLTTAWAEKFDTRWLNLMCGNQSIDEPLIFEAPRINPSTGGVRNYYKNLEILKPSIIRSPDKTMVAYLLYNPGGQGPYQTELYIGYSKIDKNKKPLKIDRSEEKLIANHLAIVYPTYTHNDVNRYYGYRDPQANAFLFISNYATMIVDMTRLNLTRLRWNTETNIPIVETCGFINCSLVPHNDPYDHGTIRSLKKDFISKKITFTFKYGNSIEINDAYTIIQQKSPCHLEVCPSDDTRTKIIRMIYAEQQKSPFKKYNNLNMELYLPSITLNSDNRIFKALGTSKDDTERKFRETFCTIDGIIENNNGSLEIKISDIHPFYDYFLYKCQQDHKNPYIPSFGDANRSYFIFPTYSHLKTGLGMLHHAYKNLNLSAEYQDIKGFYNGYDSYGPRWSQKIISFKQDNGIATFIFTQENEDTLEDAHETRDFTVYINVNDHTLTSNESSFAEKQVAQINNEVYKKYPNETHPYMRKYLKRESTKKFDLQIMPFINPAGAIGSSLKLISSFVQIASHGPLHIPSLISDYLSIARCSQYAHKKSPTMDKCCFGGSLYSLVFLSTIMRKNPLLYTAHGLVDLLQIYTSAKRLSWI